MLTSVIIFMSYSLIMSIIWFIMESPDLAITEAAVGAGVTSVLLFLTLKKVNVLKGKRMSNSNQNKPQKPNTHSKTPWDTFVGWVNGDEPEDKAEKPELFAVPEKKQTIMMKILHMKPMRTKVTTNKECIPSKVTFC
ncbi:MAG: Na(+)/H(+) antiporter subunit B [Acutalibacteraceae bacterium]